MLSISCPSRTSVSVLSALYSPGPALCPSVGSNGTRDEDSRCNSTAVTEKFRAECQDRRSCRVSVLSRVFGEDPCPSSTKHLQVSYKCQPEHHRTRLVCENERLRLLCKNRTVLAIYSATFGHLLHGHPVCPQEPGTHSDMECLSTAALRKVSRRCHGKQNCSIQADVVTFGDPCFPGTRKHLRVSFTCVPWYLLEDVGHGTDPFMISDFTHDFPEKVVLYFVSGIFSGLVFLLCIFGLRWTFIRDVKRLVSEFSELKASHKHNKSIVDYPSDDETSDNSSVCCLTKSHCVQDMQSPSMLSLKMEDEEQQRDRSPALSTIT